VLGGSRWEDIAVCNQEEVAAATAAVVEAEAEAGMGTVGSGWEWCCCCKNKLHKDCWVEIVAVE